MTPSSLLTGDACDPTTTAVDVAAALFAEARARFEGLAGRLASAQAQVDWYSSAGRAFHDRAEVLRRDVWVLSADVDDALAGLRRVQIDLAMRAVP